MVIDNPAGVEAKRCKTECNVVRNFRKGGKDPVFCSGKTNQQGERKRRLSKEAVFMK